MIRWLWQMTLPAFSIVRSLISAMSWTVSVLPRTDVVTWLTTLFSAQISNHYVFSRNWQRRMYTSSFSLQLRKAVCSILCQLLSYWRTPSINTSVVNCSLTLGHFPAAWKAALVDPWLKKPCQSAPLSNLRPVSNLQFISELWREQCTTKPKSI